VQAAPGERKAEMTKDEILAMEAGDALDALIAVNVMREITGPIMLIVGGKAVNRNWDSIILQHYSTDIAAAWPVLEKFTDVDIEKAGENYRVTINAFAQADAHTLPLAGCRAALLAVLEPA